MKECEKTSGQRTKRRVHEASQAANDLREYVHHEVLRQICSTACAARANSQELAEVTAVCIVHDDVESAAAREAVVVTARQIMPIHNTRKTKRLTR